jgi:hypothetical protein
LLLIVVIECKYCWCHITKSRMTSLPVVKYLDVFLDRSFCFISGFIATMMYMFVFETSPEAFHRRIVIGNSPERGIQHAGIRSLQARPHVVNSCIFEEFQVV